jgi:4-alpha-glucanotransferase
LRRLYCIPEGHGAADGSYVSYPIDDFIAILALESHRHRCLVVGEDLGTVPPGFREKLQAANILSYRVVMFEQDGDTGVYVPPEEYPRLSVAVAGNHDLATLLAWWEGADLKLKESLGLYPSQEETEKQLARRERDRDELVKALRQAGTLPKSGTISAADFAQAAHTFLAATPSIMTVAQLDDMIGEVEPVNIPGTSDEFPNWRRKYSQSLDELAGMEAAWAIIDPLMEKG